MLTLEPCSLCDVCADEYGPRNLPHSIPCGHVLCLHCCNNIIEKTSPRLQPVCPFCREQFTRSTVRLIRIELNGSTSGFSTPRRSPRSPRAPLIEDDFPNDLLLKASLPALPPHPDEAEVKLRAEARRLESRIARVAAKKCSVEEVSALHKELQNWLAADTNPTEASSSIYLSALLLRAILSNHFAFTEATKAAKNTEASLKQKVDELELEKTRLDAELTKHKSQYTQKAQECQSLRADLARLRAPATASSQAASSPPSTPHPSPPATRVSSPTALHPQPQPLRTTLSHGRSASTALPARSASAMPSRAPSTMPSRAPSTMPSRAPSVAPPTRSPSVMPPARAPSAAPMTRAPSAVPFTIARSATPASPASPSPRSAHPPRKTRTLSMSGAPPLPLPAAFPIQESDSHRRWFPNLAGARPLGPRMHA